MTRTRAPNSKFKISKYQFSFGGTCFKEDLFEEASLHGIFTWTSVLSILCKIQHRMILINKIIQIRILDNQGFASTVHLLHKNLQVSNFQRWECVFHQSHAWVTSQLALRLPLLMTLQSHRLFPLPPPVSNSSCLFTRFQPLRASCCSVLLASSRCYTVTLKMPVFCVFAFYVLKVWQVLQTYYNPELYSQLCQWVPRLTFMHWRRKWQPTPVFLPGESQGQRSLVGCCLWGRTESNMTGVT